MKVRVIASRPGVSAQPESSTSADFRASADSRSAMFASRFRPSQTLTPKAAPGIPVKIGRDRRPTLGTAGNHDADVIIVKREILLGCPD